MIENLASARLEAAREQIVASDSLEEHEAALIDALQALTAPVDKEVAEALLALFAVPSLERAIFDGALSDAFQQATLDATAKLAVAMGVQPVGTPHTLVSELRRVKKLEDHKLSLILERADTSTPERLQAMMIGYLTTSPSPLHVDAMAAALPDAMASAREAWDKQRALDVPARASLLEQARSEDPLSEPDRIEGLLEQTLAELDRPARLLKGILTDRDTDPDTRLLAAMLVGWMGERDLIEVILAIALSAPSDAQDIEWYGVIAARLEPARTCQAFALLLADVSWGNPEEPENAWTPARACATLVIRTLLPELGSPLESFSLERFEMDADDELKHLPRRTQLLLERWGGLVASR